MPTGRSNRASARARPTSVPAQSAARALAAADGGYPAAASQQRQQQQQPPQQQQRRRPSGGASQRLWSSRSGDAPYVAENYGAAGQSQNSGMAYGGPGFSAREMPTGRFSQRTHSDEQFSERDQRLRYLVKKSAEDAAAVPDSARHRLLKAKLKAKKRATAQLHKDFSQLLDIDGDGAIDSEEFRMFQDLERMEFDESADIDGDGVVDEMELQVAREVAGRKMMAERFVGRQDGRMFRYDPKFNGMSETAAVCEIAEEKHFAPLMRHYKAKERMFTLASSDQATGCLNVPRTGRALTGRDDDLSLRKSAHVSYHADTHVPRALRQSKSKALNSSCNWKQGGFGRRSREDVLFSARKHRVTEYNRHKGDIPGYGSFANYRHIQLLAYGQGGQ
jgi:hypothetical protein